MFCVVCLIYALIRVNSLQSDFQLSLLTFAVRQNFEKHQVLI